MSQGINQRGTNQTPTALAEALLATHGIICAVGAGGKKSTLYQLLAHASGRVGFTATAMTTTPPRRRFDARFFAEPKALEAEIPLAAQTHQRIAYACPSQKSGRVAGLPPALIADLHKKGGFDLTLVKADGARMRGIKAPRPDEPLIVPGCTTVIFVVSAHVIGQPLSEEIAHRLPILEARLGIKAGASLTPTHIGRLLSHPQGAWQGVGQSQLVTLINQVDNAERYNLAMAAAHAALQGKNPPARVVLGSMTAAQPLIDVVEATPKKADSLI